MATPATASRPTLPPMAELAREYGLTEAEYARVLSIMGREPNQVELGIFSVMWSEHCSYKTTRVHLKKLPTTGTCVICGPGENAGVIALGDGQAAVFKMESHNHPSFIEPYQGAATGVGGIMRDVFTMGARPVANLNALRFGDPAHPKTRRLLAGVVAGIGGYGNCMGVPTVGGECTFHPSYNGNILVNAMTVGLADADNIFYSRAAGVGNPVVYVGSKTGRDGIHGATMASAEFSEGSEEKRPTVQVGDPFTEKRLLEACLELMATDAIVAIQDMGAAGLTSSSLEMAGKGALGIELHLDRVPMRETGMTPYELMLSESQERMLMILQPGKEAMAQAIFSKWELDFAVIGTLTDTGRLILKWHGETAADMPVAPLSDEAPVYERPYRVHTWQDRNETAVPADAAAPLPLMDALHALMGCPDLASRRWIWEQYDFQVMNDTVLHPDVRHGGDAAVVRVHGTRKGLALTADCTPRYCYADPVEGGKQAVVETWRNITATGAQPLAITNCLNFGNPERPEIMGQIVGCLDGMAQACRALEYPIVSGNVSLYNETKEKGTATAVLPTPGIGGVGLIADVTQAVGIGLTTPELVLLVVGETRGHLSQTVYARQLLGREDGPPPPVELTKERRHGDFVRAQILAGRVRACHDLADGGLLVALAEMCLSGATGATVTLPDGPAHAVAFGEDQGRYLLAVEASQVPQVQAAAAAGVALTHVGTSGGDALSVKGHGSQPLSALRAASEGWLPQYMAG